ncbi:MULTISPECIES: CDP-glycerol:glycerophosphate glycerophosphotransferase [unclassified Listeria]|uniref:bifunctional glycosyltransferase/CDP-glycerol:glycerophosphate glycerophosphotransferase n=1 Tax=unclassified Listeria TaxID=2642072 RepID=UPI000B58D4B9|nr:MULTISPECIES: CDP-glycerol:glycerophosphate glycerophosphotransferase [unclassified Listeria]
MNMRVTENKRVAISIIVPLYNVEEVILETLKSIEAQTFDNYEVLLIDDGSTDRTIEIVKDFIKNHKLFKLIQQENAGPAVARNHGLRKAQGEYICFVDSDDIIPDNALDLMYQAAVKNNADLVTGATKRFNSEKEWFIPSHVEHNIAKPGSKTIFKNPELFYSIGPCAKLYHHQLIENLFFPETIRYGEDQPFVLHALLNAENIYTVEKVVYYYRLRDGEGESLTQSVYKDPVRILQSVFDVFDYGEKEIKNSKTPENIALEYYKRVSSVELWAALKASTESKDVDIQNTCYTMILNWFETKSDKFLNLIPSFRYFLMYSTMDRANYIRKGARDSFRKLITYLWAKQREEAKDAFIKTYPVYYQATISIIDEDNWKKAKRISNRFIIRSKLKTPRLVNGFARRILFKLVSFLPKKDYLVLATERSVKLEGNLLAIYDFMFLNNRPERIFVFLNKQRSWLEILQLYYVLGRAENIVLDDYYNKIYGLKFSKRTNVIQSWHAAGAFKKFGFSALEADDSNTEEFEARAHSPYSAVLTSSEAIVPQYAEAFRKKESQIFPIGVPRTDIFFDHDYKEYIEEVYRKQYPILREKKAILYAPTFRGGPDERKNFSVVMDVKKMRDCLSDEYVLILKFHPMIKNITMNIDLDDPFIIMIDSTDDINDVMLFSDVLITDYSSVIFEYSIMNKPMFFFAYDIDNYFDERGFYFNYEEMIPGNIYKTTDRLVEAIKLDQYDYEKLVSFRKQFMSSIDGQSTRRFIETFIDNKGGRA